MNCDHVKNLISLYIDNELDEKECHEFEEHISSCESCRNELNEMLKTVKLLRSIPQVELPSNFKAELHEKLIKVKEEEKRSTGKGLFFIGNGYFKAVSGIAAMILVIFAIRGLFFSSTMNKLSMNKYTTDSTAPEISIMMDKASQSAQGSSMQEMTDGTVVMFGTAGEPDKGFDISAKENAETVAEKSEKENSVDDTTLSSVKNGRGFMLSINQDAQESTGNEDAKERLGTAPVGESDFPDVNFSEDMFLKNANVRVKIMIYENAAKTENLEKVIRNYETTGNIVERNINDEDDNVSIIEFNIKGSDYANFATKLKSEFDTSTLFAGSNLSVEFEDPVLVEDFKVKYDEYISQLAKINARLSTLEEDKSNTKSSEKAKLIQDKDNIENNIRLLLEKYEYVANAEMYINVQEQEDASGKK